MGLAPGSNERSSVDQTADCEMVSLNPSLPLFSLAAGP